MPMPIINPLLIAALTASAGASAQGVVTSLLPAVPDAHGFAGTFTGVVGHQLLAGGGANFPDGRLPWEGGKKVWHDTLYVLDLASPEAGWKIMGRLPKANGYGVSLTAREGVLLIGGGDAKGHFQEVWLLALAADGTPVFRPMPPLPVALAQMSGALLDRQIHLCGGIETPDATHASNSHWMLDLDQLEKGWQTQAALPAVGRILATAAVVDDAFYFMAGCSLAPDAAGKPTRTYLRDAWKFSHGQWSRVADLPLPLVASASPAPVAGRSLFMVSGDDGSQVGQLPPKPHKGFSKNVLRYETGTDTWSSVGELTVPPPVTVAVTRWQDRFIFFNGEVSPGVRTPQVFLFTPSALNGNAHE